MKQTFLSLEKPPLIYLFHPTTTEEAIDLIHLGIDEGAEGFCIQTEFLLPEYRNSKSYRKIFASMGDRPIYVTNYRHHSNAEANDEQIAKGLLELAGCGATLCDVMGDMFKPTSDEMTTDPAAVDKQMKLIEQLHKEGAEVLMSSHVSQYLTAEQVLAYALNQQSRGVDIVKIVTKANTMEQQLENLRITDLLKNELKVPYLFLSGGMSEIHRRIGPMLGCCMYLCSLDDTVDPKPVQPMIRRIKMIRDNWR